MRKVLMVLALSATLAAQTHKPAPRKMTTLPARRAVPAKTEPSSASESSAPALPSMQTVEAFMKRNFGQDPTIQWKVLDIKAAEAPGVADVIVAIGEPARALHLYVLPGGDFAAVGEIIPFGAHPFATTRKKLATSEGPKRGSKNPVVVLVEFSDLECPHCKDAQPVLDRLMTDYPNAQLIFEDFPLPMHSWAMKAAEVGHCVAQQNPDAFQKYVAAVFEGQAAIDDNTAAQKLSDAAKQSGVDAAKAMECSSQPAAEAAIDRSMALGKSLGVDATPTLFINGRRVMGVAEIPYEKLKQIVDFEIEQRKAEGNVPAQTQSPAPK